jgi:hypothetical protein
MGKVWVLDTETKGTGAHVVPLENVLEKPEPRSEPPARPRKHRPASRPPAPRRSRRQGDGGEKRSDPLPPGHVRKKATGAIGRVRSVDPRAGTASVLWLRQGRTSTVPLSALSRS